MHRRPNAGYYEFEAEKLPEDAPNGRFFCVRWADRIAAGPGGGLLDHERAWNQKLWVISRNTDEGNPRDTEEIVARFKRGYKVNRDMLLAALSDPSPEDALMKLSEASDKFIQKVAADAAEKAEAAAKKAAEKAAEAEAAAKTAPPALTEDQVAAMDKGALKAACSERDLPVGGNVAALRSRLLPSKEAATE